MKIDIHTHFIPERYTNELRKQRNKIELGAEILKLDDGSEIVKHKSGNSYYLNKGFYRKEVRLDDMDERGIDVDVLSVAPTLFYYEAPIDIANWVCRTANESIAEFVAGSNRFMGLGTIPLQSIKESFCMLQFLITELGFKGIQIGTHVGEKGIWEPEFHPIYELANKFGLFIFIHPDPMAKIISLPRFYLGNLIGHSLATTITISHLLFSGVLEKYPNIKWGLAHAGGFFPFQIGRLEHGFRSRPEPKEVINKPPNQFLDRIYCDTITHHNLALEYVTEVMGCNHVVMGSDYPFAMSDRDPVRTVNDLRNISSENKKMVLGGNALLLLGG